MSVCTEFTASNSNVPLAIRAKTRFHNIHSGGKNIFMTKHTNFHITIAIPLLVINCFELECIRFRFFVYLSIVSKEEGRANKNNIESIIRIHSSTVIVFF